MTRVLLVEDDLLLARQFGSTLERSGFEVLLSHHVGSALTEINQKLPDVILLDLILPVYSGLSLLHELKAYNDTKDIPVIVCSSNIDDETSKRLKDYGVKRILDKTLMQPSDIETAIKAVI